MKQRSVDELIISEGERQIILSMHREKYLGWYTDDEGKIVDKTDANQIEICYREDDEDGWGIGGDEYISTSDIKAMADCIRSVIYKNHDKASYSCQNDLFRICLEHDRLNDSYSFTAALLEMLSRDYHITVCKSGLTMNELYQYIQPFFEWERRFPVI